MVQIEIDTSDFDRLARMMNGIAGNIDPAKRQFLVSCSVATRNEMVEHEAPKVEGTLAGGIYYEIMPDSAEVKAQQKYNDYVNLGTRPHFVSPKKLLVWARIVGANAYAVAKSIAKKGTKANPFFKRTAKKLESTYKGYAQDMVKAILKK